MPLQYCQRCGTPYSLERSTSRDRKFRYCSGICQANDGDPEAEQILGWERSSLTPTEIEELVARFRQRRQELT